MPAYEFSTQNKILFKNHFDIKKIGLEGKQETRVQHTFSASIPGCTSCSWIRECLECAELWFNQMSTLKKLKYNTFYVTTLVK